MIDEKDIRQVDDIVMAARAWKPWRVWVGIVVQKVEVEKDMALLSTDERATTTEHEFMADLGYRTRSGIATWAGPSGHGLTEEAAIDSLRVLLRRRLITRLNSRASKTAGLQMAIAHLGGPQPGDLEATANGD